MMYTALNYKEVKCRSGSERDFLLHKSKGERLWKENSDASYYLKYSPPEISIKNALKMAKNRTFL